MFQTVGKQYCECCGRELQDQTKTVWLEKSFKTDRWYAAHMCPPEESQGHFPFGEACARKMLKPADRTLYEILKSQGITTTRDSQTDTDGKRGWWDKDDNQMGRFDVVEGWEIVRKNGW